MVLYATAHVVGDQVGTEQIIAPALHSDDPAMLAGNCLVSVDPMLAEQVREGDVLLAGHAFGSGLHPEPAVVALQALGFVAVVAASAAPGFVALASDYGLPVLIAPEAVVAIAAGFVVRLDFERGSLGVRGSNQRFAFAPCHPDLVAAVRRLQLMRRMRNVVEEEGYDG
jgi:3-isopropylmalate/(R)-2-methylmalate dehydratase small subunit